MYGMGAEEGLKRRIKGTKVDYPEAEAGVT